MNLALDMDTICTAHIAGSALGTQGAPLFTAPAALYVPARIAT